MNYLQSNGVKWGTFWFDIEGPGQYWSNDQGANQQFFASMYNQGLNMGIAMGVYTSESQWVPIMGSYTGGSKLPLWYADYDGTPTFNDFSAFGGWDHPSMKQFTDQGAKCSASYDIDWYPPSVYQPIVNRP